MVWICEVLVHHPQSTGGDWRAQTPTIVNASNSMFFYQSHRVSFLVFCPGLINTLVIL